MSALAQTPGGKPNFDQLATELQLGELEKCLANDNSEKRREALAKAFQEAEARFTKREAGKERLSDDCARRYALFKLLVQDKDGKLRWQALKERQDRDVTIWDADAQILKLWKELETGSKEISDHHWSVIYHRHWLFEWLLRRYDIRRARQVMGGKSVAANAHLLLGLAVVALFALRRFELFEPRSTLLSLAGCLVAYGLAAAGLAKAFRAKLSDWPESFALALQSLVPRLAGAGTVGLVILASSQELLRVVVAANWWWLLCLLFAGYGYLLLEMSRRVHPLPRRGRLTFHGFDIAVTALAHSTALALLAEGGLRKVLCNTPGKIAPPFTWCQSASIVVFVFTIGLIVNLIWAEQPVTEPL